MNKVLKLLGVLLLIFFLFVAISLSYIKIFLPDIPVNEDLVVETTPERLVRGEYLANHVALCMDCHSTRDWTKFSGPLVPGTEGKGGEIFDQTMGFPGSYIAPNITPYALKDWSDGELYRAITNGVSKDGHALFPIMPYPNYGQMDDEDIYSIIAYIRSLAPIEFNPDPSVSDFPMNFIINTIPAENEPGTRPSGDDELELGAYLTLSSGCADCHSQSDKGVAIEGMEFAGGFEFQLPAGMLRSPNITPHETGLKGWTKDFFIKRFKNYDLEIYTPADADITKEYNSVMPWTMYAGMSEEDLGAIYTYLMTIEPKDNVVERYTPNE